MDLPTDQIDIKKGLKYGDPLALFLFILVAEGLSVLMCKAVAMRHFQGFKVASLETVTSQL
jgi:hypothetical protein